uniref:tubulin-specific chaperone A-like n=1 Tax=Ciona intestinalis TaxID=7719 RepID=UPI000180D126|nr:tubulin-specific chaperone A-like [Ciona intestinalis]|eukprot:XP_009859229.1 tubulin-specific chaperone A-like [Ciona intestinalis]
MDATLKKIKIQTGVVKRIAKETQMYKDEVVTTNKKIEEIRAIDKDDYSLKKTAELLQESEMMVSDCQKRLKTSIEHLHQLVTQNNEFKDEEIYKNAMVVLEDVQ